MRIHFICAYLAFYNTVERFSLLFLLFSLFLPDNAVRPGMDIVGSQTLPSRDPLSGGQRVGLSALGQITQTMKNFSMVSTENSPTQSHSQYVVHE